MKNSLILAAIIACLSSCKTQTTCAAYQSAFLMNDSVQAQYFSYFESDSIPKEFPKSKRNGNGISNGPTVSSYEKYHYTFPMKHVYKVEGEGADSLFGGTSATNIDNLDYEDLKDEEGGSKPNN